MEPENRLIQVLQIKKAKEGTLFQRWQISGRDSEGLEYEGFFTPKTVSGVWEAVQKELQPIAEAAPTSIGRDRLTHFLWDFHVKLPENKKGRTLGQVALAPYPESTLVPMIREVTDFSTGRVDPFLLETTFLWLYPELKSQGSLERILGPRALRQIAHLLDSATSDAINLLECAVIRDGSRIDLRSAAVCAVAELLKVPHLVVPAEAVTILLNGKAIEGTFMQRAVGLDPKHPMAGQAGILAQQVPGKAGQAGIPAGQLPGKAGLAGISVGQLPGKVGQASVRRPFFTGFAGSGPKALADLQVLDYICGNPDRHGYNLFYQLDDHGRLTGVQAIDNDCCLGRLLPQSYESHALLTGPLHMKTVSYSMWEQLTAIREDSLKKALEGFELEPEEIAAAAGRLSLLKQALKDGQAGIHVISESEWDSMAAEDLDHLMEYDPSGDHGNLFTRARVTLEEVLGSPRI